MLNNAPLHSAFSFQCCKYNMDSCETEIVNIEKTLGPVPKTLEEKVSKNSVYAPDSDSEDV